MKELYKKALSSYIEMLEIHINSKTTDPRLHYATEKYYEFLFSIAHKVGERNVDLGGNVGEGEPSNKEQKVFDIMSDLKKEIETYVKSGKSTMGTEAMLTGLLDELEDNIGSSKSLIK